MKVSSNKRILYVITKGTWGGAQRYVFDLACAAQDRGFEVLVAYGSTGALSKKLTDSGIRTVRIGGLERDIGFRSEIRAFTSLLHVIKAFDPAIVHANSSKAGLLAMLAARLAGVQKVLFTAHGWSFNEDRPWWQRLLFYILHSVTVLCSDITICVSHATKRDMERIPFVAHKLRVIHNGISEQEILSSKEARTRLIPETTTPLWIGTIAELHPTKQLSALLKAFASLEIKKDLSLILIGEGSERKELEHLVSVLGIQDHVHFCGHVPDAATHLEAFDIFVLPSRSEALGYVLLEAGLARRAVVATDVGGIPEVIKDGSTGTLVKSGDSKELASALERYIASPDLRTKHGSALYIHVKEEFSMHRMLTDTFELY